MWQYLRLHEKFVRAVLDGQHGELSAADWAGLHHFHEEQTDRMQRERLIHLIVTMSVCTFFLLALGFTVVHPSWPGCALSLLLLVLVGAYLVHYFRLENGVQRWYQLANRMAELAGRIGACYGEGRVRPCNLPSAGGAAERPTSGS